MNRRRLIALAGLALSLPTAALANDEKAERKKGGGESYIQLQILTGNTLRPDGRRGVLTVEAGVDVPDRALRTRAEQSVPRLRSAYAQVVQGYASQLPPGALPNAEFLSRELQRQTDFVLGRPGAKLLLGTILVN